MRVRERGGHAMELQARPTIWFYSMTPFPSWVFPVGGVTVFRWVAADLNGGFSMTTFPPSCFLWVIAVATSVMCV